MLYDREQHFVLAAEAVCDSGGVVGAPRRYRGMHSFWNGLIGHLSGTGYSPLNDESWRSAFDVGEEILAAIIPMEATPSRVIMTHTRRHGLLSTSLSSTWIPGRVSICEHRQTACA